MKTVSLYQQEHPSYDAAFRFSQEIYTRELGVTIARKPKYLFVLHDDGNIYGCMGLNDEVHFKLISKDIRFVAATQTAPLGTTFGEQSIFAIKNFSMGVPILIATVAEFAKYLHIDKIAYTAIGVSQRTIEFYGFKTENFGSVNLSILSPEERSNCQRWYDLHNPTLCMLTTIDAPQIAKQIMKKFGRHFDIDDLLQGVCAQYYTQLQEHVLQAS